MADIASFNNRFPEFAGVDDSRKMLFLDEAELLMADKPKWLSFYDLAHLQLAAHLLYVAEATSSGDGSSMFPVKKQEVDDVIVEHAVSGESTLASYDDMYSTSYGKAFIRYRKICLTGFYGV